MFEGKDPEKRVRTSDDRANKRPVHALQGGVMQNTRRETFRSEAPGHSASHRWMSRGGTALAVMLVAMSLTILAGSSTNIDTSDWPVISKWSAVIRHWFSRTEAAPHPVPLPRTPKVILPSEARDIGQRSMLGTDASASPVALSLILVATKPGRNMHEGSALIGVSRENPQSYVAGALLSNGAELTEIHSDYVVLARGGKHARLSLSGHAGDEIGKGLAPLLAVGGPQPVPPPAATSEEPLTEYLRPSPVYNGTELTGYQVYPGERSTAFGQLGLVPGDLITALDGVALTDPTSALEAFRSLLDGAAMKATVLRRGQVVDIALDGSTIAAERQRVGTSESHAPAGQPAISQ